MIKAALVGLGKMGISHCAILGAHPDVDLVGVCDMSKLHRLAFDKYTRISTYTDYKKMIEEQQPECLFVATPTKFHAEMVEYALDKGIHVFCEKPFVLTTADGGRLVGKASERNLVNQVGYHNRFLGTFREAKRLADSGLIGEIYHVKGEAYGPVVLKEKGETWRSDTAEGGGCLYDYASHVINLMNYMVGPPTRVGGSVMPPIYSASVDDAVYSTFFYGNGASGQLSVNWSDETYRKMTTRVTLLGKAGKLIADATELKIHLREGVPQEQLEQGWNMKYLTELSLDIDFYLRGEEYSAQVDHFIQCVKSGQADNICSFASALETDRVVEMIKADAS